jgi:hypothetical protein
MAFKFVFVLLFVALASSIQARLIRVGIAPTQGGFALGRAWTEEPVVLVPGSNFQFGLNETAFAAISLPAQTNPFAPVSGSVIRTFRNAEYFHHSNVYVFEFHFLLWWCTFRERAQPLLVIKTSQSSFRFAHVFFPHKNGTASAEHELIFVSPISTGVNISQVNEAGYFDRFKGAPQDRRQRSEHARLLTQSLPLHMKTQ